MTGDADFSNSSRVIELRSVADLNEAAFVQLASGPALAIRVPGFFPGDLCSAFADKILMSSELESYAVAPDIKKIGKAVFDAAEDPEQLEEYYQRAASDLRLMRSYFQPYLAPMDKLRLVLQECWPWGSMIEALHPPRLMFAGLIRVFGEGAEARPHQDMTNWDVPDCEPAQTLLTQFACNTYLKTSEQGGCLELWDRTFQTKGQYDRTQVPGDYGLDRDRLGPPAVTIHPCDGDLIIFNAQRVHAVTEITKGVRVAVSAFIGYRGQGRPLTVFS